LTEMYFVMKGTWSFAREIANADAYKKENLQKNEIYKIKGRYYLELKNHSEPIYIGEYYILTQSMSRYCYIARENVDTYALTKDFLNEIFEKYP
jgi:hypothetical protein